MASRSDLKEIRKQTHKDVNQAVADSGDLVSKLDSFLSGVTAPLDSSREEHRTILNFVTIARGRRSWLGTSNDDTRAYQAVIITQLQSILAEAAEHALEDGRISQAIADDIVAAYNAAW